MKGCLYLLVVALVVGGVEYAALWHTPMAGSIGLPILSAFLTLTGLGAVWSVIASWRKMKALAKNPRDWRDGELVGLSGQIRSDRAPVIAPASGKSCAIFEYELGRDGDGDSRSDMRKAFIGMVASGASLHAAGGRFHLNGFPILQQLPTDRYGSTEHLRRMAERLLAVPVKPHSGGLGSIGAALAELGEILADADGIVSHDQASFYGFDLDEFREQGESAVAALADYLYENRYYVQEKCVPEGATVTVFGRYRASDRSIDIGSGMSHAEHGLTLGAVGGRGGGGGGGGELIRSLVSLVVFGGLAVGVNYWFGRALWPSFTAENYGGRTVPLEDAIAASFHRPIHGSRLQDYCCGDSLPALELLRRLGARPPTASGSDPLDQARDASSMKALLDFGIDPNHASDDGTTTLMTAAVRGDPEVVRLLLAAGAKVDPVDRWGMTALHHAARGGNTATVAALIAAGADLDRRDRSGEAPLDEARANGADEAVALLLAKGAKETEVTAANGQAVALGSPQVQVIDAFLAATYARDQATMAALDDNYKSVRWDDIRWDDFLGGRPTRVASVDGYASADRATVRIKGPDGQGRAVGMTLGFDLERDYEAPKDSPVARNGGWRITRDWIDWSELERAQRAQR